MHGVRPGTHFLSQTQMKPCPAILVFVGLLGGGAGESIAEPGYVLGVESFVSFGLNEKADPISVAPDLWFHTERMSVGITHSSHANDEFFATSPVTSACIVGDNCSSEIKPYRGSALQVRRLHTLDDQTTFTWELGLMLRTINATSFGTKVGGQLVRVTRDGLILGAAANVQLGVVNRRWFDDRLAVPL